jgi:hypothetical protein
MSKYIEVRHKGVTVKISRFTSVKKGVKYNEYVVSDYTSGNRVRHVRSTEASAKAKAKEICEALATGEKDVLDWSQSTRDDIRHALKLIDDTGVSIDEAAHTFVAAAKLVGPDEILLACHHWRNHRPDKKMSPKNILDGVLEYLDSRKGKISSRRHRTITSYLMAFQRAFKGRELHTITALEIEDWASGKKWAKKTRNDFLSTVSLLFKYSIKRGFAVVNPADAEAIVREHLRGSSIRILMPGDARIILYTVEESLRPFLALWMFSGARKEEASRLSWEQISDGLASGAICLRADQAKTGQERSLPISANLRLWLMRYRKPSGSVLPTEWQADTETQRMQRLDDLARLIKRKTKGVWVPNGPRHSFGTFHLKLHGDPSLTVKIMGTSLAKLDKYYASRSETVTKEAAAEWFAIMPEESADIIPMVSPATSVQAVVAAA